MAEAQLDTEPLADTSDNTQPDTQTQPTQSATIPNSSNPDSETQPITSDPDAPVFDAVADRDLDAEINPPPTSSSDVPMMDGSSDLPLPPTADEAPLDSSIAAAAASTSRPPPQAPNDSSLPAVLEPEPRIPQKKDASLREFLGKMDDYAPIIPDAVTDYYLTLAGLPPPPETDRRLARLLALATQKFVADIAADAYQYSRVRSTNTTSNNPLTGLGGAAGFGMNAGNAGGDGGEGAGTKAKKDGGKAAPLGGPRAGFGGGGAGGGQGRTVLTMEDLGMAVGEYGVNVKRGEFYR